jgi:serine/threonine protein kinase/Flp pilus assembly protein TadD
MAVNTAAPHETPLEEVVESFLDRLRTGGQPTLSEYEAKYPELAAEIRDLLPALMVMEEGRKCVEDRSLGPTAQWTEAQMPRQLGEYRLLRLIGRGGMGVVFEAWQESLGRHVALKILPFNSLCQPEHLERFRREARAAARLHHTNIVPVFGVGEHEGVHYYAMQFIQGQPLDIILEEIRRLRNVRGSVAFPAPSLATTVALRLMNETTPQDETSALLMSSAQTASSLKIQKEGHYFGAVARIGLQAAEALDYAHSQGILHRDIKPSNLLLDCEGRVWIADFGLAKLEGSDVLTEPGDILGTVRYMAPERFQGQGDARSDVYGLGVTLYELLTLTPAFAQANRAVLADQIARVEPPSPRRLDARLPRDFETIVLKAMAKEPERRYANAGEMANDLRRFLADRPIRARRLPWLERIWRWRRRNAMVANLATLIAVLVLLLASGAGWVARDRALRETALDAQVSRTLESAEARLAESKWPEAEEALVRVEKLLAAAGRNQRPARLQELRRELAMARRLDDTYSRPRSEVMVNGLPEGNSFAQANDRAYAQTFREYGIDPATADVADVAEQIRSRAIRLDLARALDSWSAQRRLASTNEMPSWRQLLEIAETADPDEKRNQLRTALRNDDRKALKELAALADVHQWPPETLLLVGRALADYLSDPNQAVALLQKAQRQYPGDLWINDAVAWYCYSAVRPPRLDDAARYYTAALAIRPNSHYLRNCLGRVFATKGAYAEAEAEFARATELQPYYPAPWFNRGIIYAHLKRWDDAFACCREAIRLKPDHASSYYALGEVFRIQENYREAEGAYREASRLKPDDPSFQHCIGFMCQKQGKHAEAENAYQEAIRLKQDLAQPYRHLAWMRATCADPEFRDPSQAVALAERALQLDPDDLFVWNTLGVARYRNGNYQEAIRTLEKSVQVRKGGNSFDWFFLAMAQARMDNRAMARRWYDRAVAWMEKNQPADPELKRFRAEAEEALGIPRPPSSENKSER